MSSDTTTYKGQCMCGAVQIEVSGEAAAAGYCHCENCRRWSAAPINAFTLWPADAVKVTQGEDQIDEYNENEQTYRQWCRACGGHVMGRHPGWGMMDVFAATIPEFPFQPALHVNYESTVMPIKDGLPKMKDFPSEMGGSGETMDE